MQKNVRIEHPPLSQEQIKAQVQYTGLKNNLPSLGQALKAAIQQKEN